MQEFKGTRGPWFSDNTGAIGPISTEDNQSYGMIIPVGWVEFDHEIEVQVANQKMMAAAPELLEALQLMLNSQVLPVWHQSIARAAINKALGK
ncbi:hypothetical protein ACYBLV_26285 [Klebsiella pneumoniae]